MNDTALLQWYFDQRRYKVSPASPAGYYLHDMDVRRYPRLIYLSPLGLVSAFDTPQDAIRAAMAAEREEKNDAQRD